MLSVEDRWVRLPACVTVLRDLRDRNVKFQFQFKVRSSQVFIIKLIKNSSKRYVSIAWIKLMTTSSVNLSRDGNVQMNWNETLNRDLNSFDRHDYCLLLFYKEIVSIRNYVAQYII